MDIRRRLKAAFHTNSIQIESVSILSALMILAAVGRDMPWWGYLACALFWPLVAFVGNLIDPIPQEPRTSRTEN